MCGRHLYILTFANAWLIAKIARRDLNLLFGGKKFAIFSSETVRANAKMCGRHL